MGVGAHSEGPGRALDKVGIRCKRLDWEMTNEDPLEQIKLAFDQYDRPGAANVGASLTRDDVAWLIAEVERLRAATESSPPAEPNEG